MGEGGVVVRELAEIVVNAPLPANELPNTEPMRADQEWRLVTLTWKSLIWWGVKF